MNHAFTFFSPSWRKRFITTDTQLMSHDGKCVRMHMYIWIFLHTGHTHMENGSGS